MTTRISTALLCIVCLLLTLAACGTTQTPATPTLPPASPTINEPTPANTAPTTTNQPPITAISSHVTITEINLETLQTPNAPETASEPLGHAIQHDNIFLVIDKETGDVLLKKEIPEYYDLYTETQHGYIFFDSRNFLLTDFALNEQACITGEELKTEGVVNDSLNKNVFYEFVTINSEGIVVIYPNDYTAGIAVYDLYKRKLISDFRFGDEFYFPPEDAPYYYRYGYYTTIENYLLFFETKSRKGSLSDQEFYRFYHIFDYNTQQFIERHPIQDETFFPYHRSGISTSQKSTEQIATNPNNPDGYLTYQVDEPIVIQTLHLLTNTITQTTLLINPYQGQPYSLNDFKTIGDTYFLQTYQKASTAQITITKATPTGSEQLLTYDSKALYLRFLDENTVFFRPQLNSTSLYICLFN